MREASLFSATVGARGAPVPHPPLATCRVVCVVRTVVCCGVAVADGGGGGGFGMNTLFRNSRPSLLLFSLLIFPLLYWPIHPLQPEETLCCRLKNAVAKKRPWFTVTLLLCYNNTVLGFQMWEGARLRCYFVFGVNQTRLFTCRGSVCRWRQKSSSCRRLWPTAATATSR